MGSKRVTYTVRTYKPGERISATGSKTSGPENAVEPDGCDEAAHSEAHDRGAALLTKLGAFHEQNQTGRPAARNAETETAQPAPPSRPSMAVAASIIGTAVALSALAWHLQVTDRFDRPNQFKATAGRGAQETFPASTPARPRATKPTSVKSAKAKQALAKPSLASPGVIRPPTGALKPEAITKPDRPVKVVVPVPTTPRPSVSVLQALGNLEDAVTPKQDERTVRVKKGDTFMALLLRSGVPPEEAHAAITTMGSVYDPRRLRPGRKMKVTFGVLGSEQGRFLGISFDSKFDRTVSVKRQKDGNFVAAEKKKTLTAKVSRGGGMVDSSLFQTGLRNGVPASAMLQLINLYSFDVDFQRDIQPGDSFKMMYRDYRDQNGQVVRQGELIYAELTLRGTTLKIYRYTPSNGRTDYFNERGESNRKALMRTPIDGARLTSRFGRRRHPVLGYTRVHQGVDFGAPRGTPVYAAGDGTVVIAKWNGGYGRYVKIRHNANYQTAYAHLKRFANGIKNGVRVKQGQTIAYVGTTGRSTGPHLHYEVHVNRRAINPLALKLPSGQKLKGKELNAFVAARTAIKKQFVDLGPTRTVASADKNVTKTGKQKVEDDK